MGTTLKYLVLLNLSKTFLIWLTYHGVTMLVHVTLAISNLGLGKKLLTDFFYQLITSQNNFPQDLGFLQVNYQ